MARSATAPSMRRPPRVNSSVPLFPRRMRSQELLPRFHSHSLEPLAAPVHVGVLRPAGSRRCNLRGEVRGDAPASRRCAQSPHPGISREGTRRFPVPPLVSVSSLAGYAAAVLITRNGSYRSPLIQIRCSTTASFRATATIARFFAFFPPRSASRRPQRRMSQSRPL